MLAGTSSGRALPNCDLLHGEYSLQKTPPAHA
jgi:hypothetical protein